MKHEQPTNAHPSRTHTAGHPTSHRGGGQGKPSPAFDSKDSSDAADGFSFLALLMRLFPAVGVCLLALTGLVTLASAAALRTPDPTALLTPLSWGAVGVSALLGGVVAGRRCPDKAAAAGLLVGAMMVLLVTLAGFLIGKATPSAWILRLCILPLSLIGALIARPRPRAAAHGDHRAGHAHAGHHTER